MKVGGPADSPTVVTNPTSPAVGGDGGGTQGGGGGSAVVTPSGGSAVGEAASPGPAQASLTNQPPQVTNEPWEGRVGRS